MSESTEGGEKTEKGEKDLEQPSDDEDDYEGYFLEPVGNIVNIAEKIAEANRKLLEETEGEVEEDESRIRKVQFSEELVNFEPNYYSDDDYTQSGQNSIISEEDLDLKTPHDPKIVSKEKNSEDDIPEEIPEEEEIEPNIEEEIEKNSKFILILLPKEQNSSCESIIGEEIPEEKNEVKETKTNDEKPAKTKIARPKSAKKSCEMAKISPNMNYNSNIERKSWQTSRNPAQRTKPKEGGERQKILLGEIKVEIKRRSLKKINVDDLKLDHVTGVGNLKRCGGNRPRSCYAGRNKSGDENRPKTAPECRMQRSCCVIQAELPHYNGLKSEYGLSAEQLQERKQKALESRLEKKQEQMKKRQEELKKRIENEETFQKWLFNKTKKSLKKKSLKLRDTLTRSDVYIQTHASYAANRSVPYSLDLSYFGKKTNRKKEIRGNKKKPIIIEKLFDNTTTPHFKRSFNIYMGVKN